MLAKNLRKYRQVKGMSQQQLAEKLGLSRSNIASYEEGRAMPKADNLVAIAKTIGTSTENLTQRELTVNELLGFQSPNVAASTSVPPSSLIPIHDEGRSQSPERMTWNTGEQVRRLGIRILSNRHTDPRISQGDILIGGQLKSWEPDQTVIVKSGDRVWLGTLGPQHKEVHFSNRNHAPVEIEDPEHLEVFGVHMIIKGITL